MAAGFLYKGIPLFFFGWGKKLGLLLSVLLKTGLSFVKEMLKFSTSNSIARNSLQDLGHKGNKPLLT